MNEQAKARQEACCNASETEYFGARPRIDTLMQRHNFCAGFYRGYAAALAAASAQQPWKYIPPAQERIQALELEVRQLTEQIAELRGGGAAKEYAELPESCYEDDSGLKTYDSGDMRTFADATHALRIQQPAPSAAPEEPLQAFDSPRAKSLMRAWEEGWEACRDAEYVGEEAQNDAFNSSYTLTLCLAEDQLLPTPQADSVLEDAERWQMAVLVGKEVMLPPANRPHQNAVKAYMDAVYSGLDLTGAVDAARKQGGA